MWYSGGGTPQDATMTTVKSILLGCFDTVQGFDCSIQVYIGHYQNLTYI